MREAGLRMVRDALMLKGTARPFNSGRRKARKTMDEPRTGMRSRKQTPAGACSWRTALPAAGFVLLGIWCAGCRTGGSESQDAPAVELTGISQEELRSRLNEFGEYFVNRVRIAAQDIERRDSSSKARRLTLIWRVRFSKDLYTMLEQPDPVKACIDAWSVCVRIVQYLEERKGQGLLDESLQQIAIDALDEVLAEVERIARLFLDDEAFRQAQREVVAFARQHPIESPYSVATVYASRMSREGRNPLQDIISVPLVPFKAVQGVDRGAEAIHDFTGTADRFADIVELLPESIHWQLLLWLYEFEETELAQQVLGDISAFSETGVRLADTLEQFPEQVRKETSTLFNEIDDKQENLRTTLQTLNAVVGSMEKTAASITETAHAWESVVETTGQFVKDVSPPKPAAEVAVQKESARPFDINDYQATADALTKTAGELTTLTTELRALVESGSLNEAVSEATTSAGKLADRVTLRLAMLIVLVFVLVVIGRVAIPRRK